MIKTLWIETYSRRGHDHIVDGSRLASDSEKALWELDSSGYTIVSIVPVILGRYECRKYDSRVTKE